MSDFQNVPPIDKSKKLFFLLFHISLDHEKLISTYKTAPTLVQPKHKKKHPLGPMDRISTAIETLNGTVPIGLLKHPLHPPTLR